MDGAKFITVSNIATGFSKADFQIIVFPPVIAHDQMVSNLSLTKDDVHGAGFVAIGCDGNAAAQGKSVSLGIDAREEDTLLLNQLFQTQAFYDAMYGTMK